MKESLDDVEALRKIDKNNMLNAIYQFPHSAGVSIKDAEKLNLGILPDKDYTSLLIAGMGGSAVGGLLLKDWLYDTCSTPIYVSRGYHLPRWVDENTLVFVVSYSGNTEETISQMREAQNKKCKIVTFASGGNIMQLSTQKNIPCLKFPKGYQPRAAIAFQFFGLAEIAHRFGLAKGVWDEVDEAIYITKNLRDEMDVGVDVDENIGKKLAVSLYGYVPMIYGSRIFTAVSYRYCTQFNENSKIPAGNSFFPEAFHNSIMARESSIELLKRLCAVIIRDPKEEQVMSAKITKFCDLMGERLGNLVEIEARGEGRLARIASALYIGDYVSAYLGLLYGQNPSSTESIAILKS